MHVDIKKLGRFPDGDGHQIRAIIGNCHNKRKGLGYASTRHAVDDHSRLAYSEEHHDERKETVAASWERPERSSQPTISRCERC